MSTGITYRDDDSAASIARSLADSALRAIDNGFGNNPTGEVQAAQVLATLALVHALRDLIGVVDALGDRLGDVEQAINGGLADVGQAIRETVPELDLP